jgi:hypothetical protein
MCKVILAAFTILISSVCIAQAQWLHNSEDNPFSKSSTQIAVTAKSGHLAGFRCTGADDLTLVYTIPEKVSDQTTQMLQVSGLKLLAIVDDGSKIEMSADVEVTPNGEKYRIEATGDEVVALIKAVAGAKKRLALATEIMGKTFYPTTFGIDGSRSVLTKLSAGCKLSAAAKS